MIDFRLLTTGINPDNFSINDVNAIIKRALGDPDNEFIPSFPKEKDTGALTLLKQQCAGIYYSPITSICFNSLYLHIMFNNKESLPLNYSGFWDFYKTFYTDLKSAKTFMDKEIYIKSKMFTNYIFGAVNNEKSVLISRPDFRQYVVTKSRELVHPLYKIQSAIYVNTDEIFFNATLDEVKEYAVSIPEEYSYGFEDYQDGIFFG